MKRYFGALILTVACLMTLAAHADTIDDQINAAQSSLNDHLAKREALTNQWPAFEQKKSDIEFAYAAYQKQAPIVKQEIAAWTQKEDSCAAQFAAYVPALNQLEADGTRHNNTSCTEKCDQNGSCDGTCAWYEAERQALEQRQATLKAQVAPILAQKAELEKEGDTLQQSAKDLDTIMDNVSAQTLQWTADVKQFKADWDDNEAQIQVLQNTLARLKQIKTAVDSCTRSIPAECEAPNTPYWVGQCAKMHADCGRIFDGNQ